MFWAHFLKYWQFLNASRDRLRSKMIGGELKEIVLPAETEHFFSENTSKWA
jgi:hypothetical protein